MNKKTFDDVYPQYLDTKQAMEAAIKKEAKAIAQLRWLQEQSASLREETMAKLAALDQQIKTLQLECREANKEVDRASSAHREAAIEYVSLDL